MSSSRFFREWRSWSRRFFAASMTCNGLSSGSVSSSRGARSWNAVFEFWNVFPSFGRNIGLWYAMALV